MQHNGNVIAISLYVPSCNPKQDSAKITGLTRNNEQFLEQEIQMQRTHKFRMCPSRQNQENMLRTLNKCRLVYNSMLEILNRALGREPPESAPVEIGPLLMGIHEQVWSWKQEAPSSEPVRV